MKHRKNTDKHQKARGNAGPVIAAPFLESGLVAAHSSFPAGICGLRQTPASKAESMHVQSTLAQGQDKRAKLYCM